MESDVENCKELDRCVNEYCADSLIELIIEGAPRYIMNHFKKPFSKIETIKFERCHLAKNSTDFNRWFPMMHRLVFDGTNELVDSKCIVAHFAHLNELEIRIGSTERFTEKNVAEALRMNPNIRILRINADAASLQDLSRNLQLLEILEIEWSKPCPENFPKIHFKNVKTLAIIINDEYFDNGTQHSHITFPFSFDQLKELTFTTVKCELVDAFFVFIRNQTFLDKLTLKWSAWNDYFDESLDDPYFKPCSDFKMSWLQASQMAKACSNLTEININNSYMFPIDNAKSFLNLCSSLKKIRFQSYPCEVHDFIENLSNEWQASIGSDYIEVERKIGVENQVQVTEDNEKTGIEDESSESDHGKSDFEESDSISQTSSAATELNKPRKSDSDDSIDKNLENNEYSELLRAAESNAQQKLTIDFASSSNYQMETVNFSASHDQPIEQKNGTIFIGDKEICLSFLHCFGHLIVKISLDSDDDQLIVHLNEYCADSLIELNISHTKNKEFHAFKKIFSNVEVLELSKCVLSRQLTDFNTWFPKIQLLMFLDQIELDDRECINIKFRHLKYLSIDVQTKMNDKLVFDVKNMKMALRLNPQIRSLAFYNVDAKYLHGVSKHLQLLESLHIKWHKDVCYSDLDEHNIHFKSVQKLEIIFHPDDTNVQGIPLSFDRLKTFELVAKRLNKNSIDFISKHPTITELSLTLEEENRDVDLFHCVKALSSLQIFNLDFVLCSPGGVIYVLDQIQSLKILRFRISDHSKYDPLCQLLSDQWQTSIDDTGYVQLKREIDESM